MKRMRPRAKGRGDRILSVLVHITVKVADSEAKEDDQWVRRYIQRVFASGGQGPQLSWYADSKTYAKNLLDDLEVASILEQTDAARLAESVIERPAQTARVTFTRRVRAS